MKTLILIASIALCATMALAADTTNNVGNTQYPHKFDPVHGITRGTLNFLTCWLEMPRCVVVENAEHPVFGVGTGLLQGTFFMTTRIILSTADYLMFGFTGPSAYDADWLPEYVWQAQWYPYVGKFSGTNFPHAVATDTASQ